jgi:hypothetical protein
LDLKASARADDGSGGVAPKTAATGRSTPCLKACADIESGTFTSGWPATLQRVGRDGGPARNGGKARRWGLAGAPVGRAGMPHGKAPPATGWVSVGEGFDGRGSDA